MPPIILGQKQIKFNTIMDIPNTPSINFRCRRGGRNITQQKLDELEAKKMAYEGPIDGFPGWDVGNIKGQYDTIQKVMTDLGFPLVHLKGCIFIDDGFYLQKKFVAYSACENIIWNLYKSMGLGSGHNKIIINGCKMNLSQWLKMNDSQRKGIMIKTGLIEKSDDE